MTSKCCVNCTTDPCSCRDIILSVIDLLRVIDQIGTRKEEIEATNRLKSAVIALGYSSDGWVRNDTD